MKTLKIEAVYPMAYETFPNVANHLRRSINKVDSGRGLRSALGYLSPATGLGLQPPANGQIGS